MPQSERTPLLQTVPVAEAQERYPHQRTRRFCTIVLTAAPLVTLAVVFLIFAVTGRTGQYDDHPSRPSFLTTDGIPHSDWPQSEGLSYKKLKKLLAKTPDADKAREWSKYYTAGPHLAGKNLSQAEWTRDRWEEFGVEQSAVVAYDVYINYPVDHGLTLVENDKVTFEAVLEEDVLEDDPTTGMEDRVPTFHGYSASGDVTASYVFVNYGTYGDFDELERIGVDLQGKIALAKYGRNFRGLKVKRAEELGMVGVVMYSDPGDDGQVTEENGHKTYPDGPARNPSSVQRGSVQYLSILPGDPTTPGYPSKPGAPRGSPEGHIPSIPSLPISYADALPILRSLNGHGPNASTLSSWWHGGGLRYKGVHYNIGPTPSTTTLHLVNTQNYTTTPLWDVIGIINGTIPDEVIVVGNHRDAWIAGGAGDPNSGSAALNEVVRSFGAALKKGWKPLRTIVFASWDGEEYGLVGSTEWVEEYLPWLQQATVAYVNVDVGSSGPNFKVSSAPLLNRLLHSAVSDVPSPNQTTKGQTVLDVWNKRINTMGSGSDFTAFQDFAGIPSIDIGFDRRENDPVYHYHSNYDSFHWMEKQGDPGFQYHETIAKIINMMVLDLVETPVIPFNATDYAVGLEKYLDKVKTLLNSSTKKRKLFKSLDHAISSFQSVSRSFDAKAQELSSSLSSSSTLSVKDKADLYTQARAINTAYKLLERQFLYSEGLDGRSWFKHVVFAPGLWTGYAGDTFPGLVEAIAGIGKGRTRRGKGGDGKGDEGEDEEGDLLRWVDVIENRVDGAVGMLEAQL